MAGTLPTQPSTTAMPHLVLAATPGSWHGSISGWCELHSCTTLVLAVPSHLPSNLQEGQLLGLAEVDEACFGKKRYGRQTIVVGAIERDTRKLRLEVVPDTEQDSLELFITTHIARSSLVLTDYHGGYNGLAWYGYSHERCNHSAGHFGPTNQIENTWSVMKRHLRKIYGCAPTTQLRLILNEWMARHNNLRLFASPTAYLQEVCSVRVD